MGKEDKLVTLYGETHEGERDVLCKGDTVRLTVDGKGVDVPLTADNAMKYFDEHYPKGSRNGYRPVCV